jgi:hypothetical protein
VDVSQCDGNDAGYVFDGEHNLRRVGATGRHPRSAVGAMIQVSFLWSMTWCSRVLMPSSSVGITRS